MTHDRKESLSSGELRNEHLKKFGIKALVLIPLALLGWLLAMTSPMGALVPVLIVVGGAVVLAIDCVLRPRTERHSVHG